MGIGSFIIYSIIIVGLMILIYTLYIVKNKSSILTMTQFYKKWDKLLTSKSRIVKFIRHYMEKYYALALKIPGFNFSDPVYFVGKEIVHIKTGISSDLTIQNTSSNTQNTSSNIPHVVVNPVQSAEIVVTSLDELKQSIKNTMTEDAVFLGMSNTALKNMGIAVGIQIGASLATVAAQKFAKTAAGKAIGTGLRHGTIALQKTTSNYIKSLAKRLGIKATQRASVKVATGPTLKTTLREASKRLLKLITRLGTKVASRLGLTASKSLASKALKSTGAVAKIAIAKGGQAAGKIGSFATKAAAKAGMGPAGWAMLGFDALSLGLDAADAGGYAMLEEYKAVRDERKKAMLEVMKQYNLTEYYYEVGPLDKYIELAGIEYEDNMFKEQKAILAGPRGAYYKNFIKDTVFEPNLYSTVDIMYDDYITKLKATNAFDELEKESVVNMCKKIANSELYNGVCYYNDIWEQKQGTYINKYIEDLTPIVVKEIDTFIMANPDMNEVELERNLAAIEDKHMNLSILYAKANDQICIEDGGALKSGHQCVYKTKAQCDAHYKMVDSKPENKFTVWDDSNKKCMTADYAIPQLCADNKLKYDPKLGICEITEDLCKRKGAQWNAQKKDCYVSQGQQIAEFIFGETITRGLIQVFDPDQYNPCPPETIDRGYLCSKKTIDPSHCNVYGSHWWNNGTQCTNTDLKTPAKCKDHEYYTNVGLTCEPNSYGRGFGVSQSRTHNWGCPSTHPYKRGVDGAGWCDDNNGLDFWNTKTSGYVWTPKSDHLAYSNSTGVSDKIKNGPYNGWELCGLLSYPKCPAGTHAVGCNICRGGPRGSVATGYPADNIACPAGFFRGTGGGHCYQYPKGTTERVSLKDYKCPTGTKPYLGRCRAVCTAGTKDTGLDCWKTRKYAYSTQNN
jgi:hypothetical protein